METGDRKKKKDAESNVPRYTQSAVVSDTKKKREQRQTAREKRRSETIALQRAQANVREKKALRD